MLERNTKSTDILCPECGQKNVVLHRHGHKYAGVYSCETTGCGASWSCDHPACHQEVIEVDDGKRYVIFVCNDCELDCTEEMKKRLDFS